MKKVSVLCRGLIQKPFVLLLASLVFPLYYMPYNVSGLAEMNDVSYSIILVLMVTSYFFLIWSDYTILVAKDEVKGYVYSLNVLLKIIGLLFIGIYVILFGLVTILAILGSGFNSVMKIESIVFIGSLIFLALLINNALFFKKNWKSEYSFRKWFTK